MAAANSDTELANSFADFFINKIEKMRQGLEAFNKFTPPKSSCSKKKLDCFRDMTHGEIEKIIKVLHT